MKNHMSLEGLLPKSHSERAYDAQMAQYDAQKARIRAELARLTGVTEVDARPCKSVAK